MFCRLQFNTFSKFVFQFSNFFILQSGKKIAQLEVLKVKKILHPSYFENYFKRPSVRKDYVKLHLKYRAQNSHHHPTSHFCKLSIIANNCNNFKVYGLAFASSLNSKFSKTVMARAMQNGLQVVTLTNDKTGIISW